MSLNVEIFRYCDFYNKKQFEIVLGQIWNCSVRMLRDAVTLENNENILRNRLYADYLNNNIVREELNLQHFIFSIEHPEINENYNESGRHDIRVCNPSIFCYDTSLYYIIECKRLNNNSKAKNSLNWKYVNYGIKRFIERKDYSSGYKFNGMIGFMVANIEVLKLIPTLNDIIKENIINTKTHRYLTNVSMDTVPKNSYVSEHDNFEEKEIVVYHLMIDLSSKIMK